MARWRPRRLGTLTGLAAKKRMELRAPPTPKLTVFAVADGPLRARQVCEAMGMEVTRDNSNNTRLEVERMAERGILVETEQCSRPSTVAPTVVDRGLSKGVYPRHDRARVGRVGGVPAKAVRSGASGFRGRTMSLPPRLATSMTPSPSPP